MATTTRTITIPPQLDPVAVLGPVDEVIREVERAFPDLTIIVRGNRVAIVSRSKQTEAQAAQAEDLVNTIIQAAYTAPMDADTVRRMLDQNVLKNHVRLEHPGHARCVTNWRNRPQTNAPMHVLPAPTTRRTASPRFPRHHLCCRRAGPCENRRTSGLRERHRIAHHHLRHWPAGTGKTYLAVAKAVRAFQDKQIRRIILTRPAVEAGEASASARHAE